MRNEESESAQQSGGSPSTELGNTAEDVSDRRRFLKSALGAGSLTALGAVAFSSSASALEPVAPVSPFPAPIINPIKSQNLSKGRLIPLPLNLVEANAQPVFTHPYGLWFFTIFPHRTAWYMFYNHGLPEAMNLPKAIGLAKSIDKGLTWSVVNDNLLNLVPGTFESQYLEADSVLYFGGKYRLYYAAADYSVYRVGVAEATNVEGPYTRSSSNPVLSPDPYGWDQNGTAFPTVTWYRGRLHMFYGGINYTPASYYQTGHATSIDGLNWTKDPLNPLAGPTGSGWRANGVAPHDVLMTYDGGLILIAGGDYFGPPRSGSLGIFTMDGGSILAEWPSNPILGTVGAGRGYGPGRLVLDEDTLYVFYSFSTPIGQAAYRLPMSLAP